VVPSAPASDNARAQSPDVVVSTEGCQKGMRISLPGGSAAVVPSAPASDNARAQSPDVVVSAQGCQKGMRESRCPAAAQHRALTFVQGMTW